MFPSLQFKRAHLTNIWATKLEAVWLAKKISVFFVFIFNFFLERFYFQFQWGPLQKKHIWLKNLYSVFIFSILKFRFEYKKI